MTQPEPKLIIIDGHALAFRTFHGMSATGLRSTSGEPTYAVYGFANILLSIIQEHKPNYIAVSFDIGPTFRHKEYPAYKANRTEPPEEFRPQLQRIKQLVDVLGVPIYTAENYEADDVIGTIARQATAQHIHTRILTGDTDTLQLVNDHVSVLLANPFAKKGDSTTVYDEQKVRERYKGLRPNQLADLRGLKGDASDNIPGVSGIGEAGAIALLNEFGTIEALYDHLDDVPKRYRKYLEGQREQALFSKYLAQIVCDVPVTLDTQAATVGTYDRAAVVSLFQELEFRTLLEKLPPQHNASAPKAISPDQSTPAAVAVAPGTQLQMFDVPQAAQGGPLLSSGTSPGTYQAVVTEEHLNEVLNKLAVAPACAFDTECTSLQPFQAKIVGISLAIEPGAAWYIPIGHRQGEQLPREQVLAAVTPLFADPQRPKYAHNAKFDIEVLIQAGIETHGVTMDTMIAAGLLGKRKGLKDLALYELNISTMQNIETLIGRRGAKQTTFDYVPIEYATPYAAADADITLRLVETLTPQMNERSEVRFLFDEVEMPLIPILVDMERTGICLDLDTMRDLSKRLQQRIADIETDIYKLAGTSFNINSGIQLNTILFDRLKLSSEGLSKTTKGRISMKADVLEKLRGSHEIVQMILDYRHLTKLTTTYVDVLPTLVHPETKRIHTSFNQMGTETGRLASSSPNMQNIPIRTKEGSEIRRGFVASPGCQLIAADYSQIELRVLAHITQDPNLVQAFLDGQDIHAATAAQLFKVPIDQVEKEQRRMAKMTVFGIIYGISSFGLAQRTDMSRKAAQSLIDEFFARFPGVQRYIDETLEQGRQHGYVQSMFGRRRAMPDLNTSGQRRQAAEREAINTPIQATAADIMKLAMIRVARELQHTNAKLVLQVHDELIIDTPREEVEQVQHRVRVAMEQVYRLNVPLKVDIEVGDNWEHMETVTPA